MPTALEKQKIKLNKIRSRRRAEVGGAGGSLWNAAENGRVNRGKIRLFDHGITADFQFTDKAGR